MKRLFVLYALASTSACGHARVETPASAPRREVVLLDVDLTTGSAGPGLVEGGAWDGGWRVVAEKGDRIVFDAGHPVAAGYFEVRFTMRSSPYVDPPRKVNWVGLYEDASLSQNTGDGDVFYARAGNPKYRFSKAKAYGKKFDKTEWEPAVGDPSSWVTDDRTVHTVRLEWRDGRAIFHDPRGDVTPCPEKHCNSRLPIDELRYAFIGGDRYLDYSLVGLRFLRAKLVEYQR